jgi:hypothetical protein
MIVSLVLQIAWGLGIPYCFWLRGSRILDGGGLERWAERFGAPLTEETVPYLQAHLRHGLRWRHGLGAAVFVATSLLPGVASIAWRTSTPRWIALVGFGGYLVGATAAELRRWAMPAGRSGRAALVSRRVTDYVPAWPLRIIGVVSIVVAASAAVAMHARRIDPDSARYGESATTLLAGVAAVACVVVLVGVTLLTIAGRRQSSDSPELLRADEALRSHSAHIVAALALVTCAYASLTSIQPAAYFLGGSKLSVVGFFVTVVMLGLATALSRDSVWRAHIARERQVAR